MEHTGTIIFTTVGRPHFGFDVFSVNLHSLTREHRLTDGTSINFNGNFVDDDQSLVFISERSGSPRIFLTRPGTSKSEQLPSAPGSHFHDRPILRENGRLYFISAHEPADSPFKSWAALYSSRVGGNEITRLTPYGVVDYSPAISQSGKLIAVASYGSKHWKGDFRELNTEIVVFSETDPNKRTVVAKRGGWPTWSGDSTIFFHGLAEDGWWSIYRVDLPDNFESLGVKEQSQRVTPPGLHAFTPAAFHDGGRIAVATRRKGTGYRHVELFDIVSEKFSPVTEAMNPNFHHYSPFVSTGSKFLGYHRFRGESAQGDSVIPYLEPVVSPIKGLRMLRLNGTFPAVSPDGDLVAYNHDYINNGGIKVVKSDGSKGWTLMEGRTAFCNSWSPVEKNVIFTSVGPIFAEPKSTVQIARVTFDPSSLDDGKDVSVDIKILTMQETGNNAFPSCSPDGKFIVFRSGRSGNKNLYIMDAVNGEFDGGSVARLTEGPWIDTMPSWSPVGDLIAFSSNRHRPDNPAALSVYLIRPDGTGLRRVHVAGLEGSSDVDRERITHVCFSPDGQWLLLTANIGGVTAEPVSMPNQFQPYGELYAVRLDGSGLRRLTWSECENGTPTWHSNGRGLLDLNLNLEFEMGGLSLGDVKGEKLRGEFEEPLWLTF
ncbi:hypothetical protein Nepgr_029859 [Nepenthes gracilis]|uniref:Uncharacterized protein n=1 Tax=Nepenthes gracilis TaxID=150966 RepID=A0AAD3TF36_NEPGR|nr:hypothetical protein Nepgr_029859 [Nepenthes gracilis]